ncbi:MAG: hypothetical protein LBJ17_03075, partial [Dysgonamonadaceae bacterium]|nr:hypothetical protein [Dysgonamonadaceae bacterium]
MLTKQSLPLRVEKNSQSLTNCFTDTNPLLFNYLKNYFLMRQKIQLFIIAISLAISTGTAFSQ